MILFLRASLPRVLSVPSLKIIIGCPPSCADIDNYPPDIDIMFYVDFPIHLITAQISGYEFGKSMFEVLYKNNDGLFKNLELILD
jgi:hypothetical protein